MEAILIEINLNAIASNLREIKKYVGNKVKIMPVIKADAYGHGLVPVGKTLAENGADFLAVSYVSEAISLRKAGIDTPIVILLGISKEEIKAVFEYRLIPVIYHQEMATILSKEAKRHKNKVEVFVKIDTGMGRLGIFYKEAISFLKRISSLSKLDILGITSHLAVAESNKEFTKSQLNRFKKVLKDAREMGLRLPYNHIANSAAILGYDNSLFDVIRPGLSIYGVYPAEHLKEKIKLEPAMSVKTKVIYIKWLPPNVGVSYGHTFITSKKTKIAVLPIGYDQGLFRQLSNKGQVLIKGKRAPIIGTICMHLTMVDVTHIKDVSLGEEVVIMGKQNKEEITAEEIAKKANTISYDILCRFGKNYQRRYIC